jgi:hypothetical protein
MDRHIMAFWIMRKPTTRHPRECLHSPSRENAHCWDIKAHA